MQPKALVFVLACMIAIVAALPLSLFSPPPEATAVVATAGNATMQGGCTQSETGQGNVTCSFGAGNQTLTGVNNGGGNSDGGDNNDDDQGGKGGKGDGGDGDGDNIVVDVDIDSDGDGDVQVQVDLKRK